MNATSAGTFNVSETTASTEYVMPQTSDELQAHIESMRAFVESGATLDIAWRLAQLTNLRTWLKQHEDEVLEALHADLGKVAFEGYACELGLVYDEIRKMIGHMRAWSKPQCKTTPLALMPAKARVYPVPYGVCAISSPWNYPVNLALIPLVDALAAGNCVVLKPSHTSKHTTALIARLCREVFDPHAVICITGPHVNEMLLDVNVDKMFFTGSPGVGKRIMARCAETLTPVTLELGGKSPCIVDQTANIRRAAERIAWGKCLNSGQTCVAPDYILVHESQQANLVRELKRAFNKYFGAQVLTNCEYPHMINEHHFDRVCGLIDNHGPQAEVAWGGGRNRETLRIEPTIMTGVTLEDPIMHEEIFGPVLPLITWSTLDEALAVTKHFGHPLACYVFSSDKAVQDRIIYQLPCGGITINDVIIHLANNAMGFGGFGESGMGSYHGKAGFDCFTHYKSTMKNPTCINIPVRNAPYKNKLKLVRMLMR